MDIKFHYNSYSVLAYENGFDNLPTMVAMLAHDATRGFYALPTRHFIPINGAASSTSSFSTSSSEQSSQSTDGTDDITIGNSDPLDHADAYKDEHEDKDPLEYANPGFTQPKHVTRNLILNKAIGIGSERNIFRAVEPSKIKKSKPKCAGPLSRTNLIEGLLKKVARSAESKKAARSVEVKKLMRLAEVEKLVHDHTGCPQTPAKSRSMSMERVPVEAGIQERDERSLVLE